MKILLVGVSVRAMAESAVSGGYRVAALDAFGDSDLRALAESYALGRDFGAAYSPGNLYRAGRGLRFDAVAYTSNLENHPRVLARFGRSHRIVGNAPGVVASVRDWGDLFDRLGRAGFRAPRTLFAQGRPPAGTGRRWLWKPLRGGGGHGIVEYDPGGGRPPGCMLQEFIPGTPCSATFVANGRESRVLGITQQLAGLGAFGAAGFRYCGNILPAPEAADPAGGPKLLGEVRRLADFLTGEFGLSGVNGIDFVSGGGCVYLTEVNPRYSASMELVEAAYGLPVFDMHARSALYGELPGFDLGAELGRGRFYGKAILYAARDAVAPATGAWRGRGIRDVPHPGERIPGGSPVCTILADGPAPGDALAGMLRRAEAVKEEMYG